MFSLFRPQHRRTGSAPTSPESSQWPQQQQHSQPSLIPPSDSTASPSATALNVGLGTNMTSDWQQQQQQRPSSFVPNNAHTNIPSRPPVLPPILRVSSGQCQDKSHEKPQQQHQGRAQDTKHKDKFRPPPPPSNRISTPPRIATPPVTEPGKSIFDFPQRTSTPPPPLDFSPRRSQTSSIVSTLKIPDLPVIPRDAAKPAAPSFPKPALPPQQLSQQRQQQQQQQSPSHQQFPLLQNKPTPPKQIPAQQSQQRLSIQQHQTSAQPQLQKHPQLPPSPHHSQSPPQQSLLSHQLPQAPSFSKNKSLFAERSPGLPLARDDDPFKGFNFSRAAQTKTAQDQKHDRSNRQSLPGAPDGPRHPLGYKPGFTSSRENLHRPVSSSSNLSYSELAEPPDPPEPSGAAAMLPPPQILRPKRTSSPSGFSYFQPKSSSSLNLSMDAPPSPTASMKAPAPPQQPAQPVPRAPKPSRINLLNPMSLLLRRRSSNTNEAGAEAQLVPPRNMEVPAITVPDDYDPRIRGPGVHDFNAPRARRQNSQIEENEPRNSQSDRDADSMTSKQSTLTKSTAPDEQHPQSAQAESSSRVEPSQPQQPTKKHTPVFTEHLDDDFSGDESGVRRESLANPAFLARVSRQYDLADPISSSLPNATVDSTGGPSPRDKTSGDEQMDDSVVKGDQRTSKQTEASYRISSDRSTIRSSVGSDDTRATSPPLSPSQLQSRTSFTSDAPFQVALLPKHLSSTASRASSRFSFQLTNDRSIATEKSLEEKHKQKAAAAKSRKHESLLEDDYEGGSDDEFANFDMDDGGYEDDIPYTNLDDDNEEQSGFEVANSVLRPIDTPLNPLPTSAEAIVPAKENDDGVVKRGSGGLQRRVPKSERSLKSERSSQGGSSLKEKRKTFSLDEDDMYYDDGMIQDILPAEESGTFDESALDAMEKQDNPVAAQPNGFVGTMPTLLQPQPSQLTSQNLNAYHSALASAANRAEADGRFLRKDSINTEDISPSAEPIRPTDVTAVEDTKKMLNNDGFQVPNHYVDESNYDDFDIPEDDLDDDTMIAEANAEALAADEVGFYGSEFNFYSQSNGGSTEMVNGGYFGEAGAPGVGRSASGRNYSREPNLTPITERSEFSTRNSMISMNASGIFSAPSSGVQGPTLPWESSQPTPGLKELASRIGSEDDDMTLSQLIKLRKGAFGEHRGSWGGGSVGSVPSSSGNSFVVSSPVVNISSSLSHDSLSNLGMAASTSQLQGQRKLSDSAIAEDESEDDSSMLEEVNRASSSPSRTGSPDLSNEATPRPVRQKNSSGFGNNTALDKTTPPVPSMGPPIARPVFVSFKSSSSSSASSSQEGMSPESMSMSTPMPPPSLRTKFASRPQPVAYHSPVYSPVHSPSHSQDVNSSSYNKPVPARANRNSGGAGGSHGSSGSGGGGGADSVAYVKEGDDDDGQNAKWYLERRRRLSSGEVVVVERQFVEGWRI